MAIYGFVRHSLLKKEKLAEGQIAEMARKAEELGGSLKGVFVDPGSSGKKTTVLSPSSPGWVAWAGILSYLMPA